MCTSARSYEDLQVSRRDEFSNFVWVSRQIRPQLAYERRTKTLPQDHKDAVLASPKITELLDVLSRQQNVPIDEMRAKVALMLDEIGYEKKLKVIRWLGLALVKICNKVCGGVFVNTDSVVKLKATMGSCPVVFVPSHRSYADFILMSYICFSKDLAVPAIAAGMDFQGMWGMGTILRDTGAFFMRRSYNDDALYWTTFKQYVYQIVTNGDLPIEFFIEGTRSRTNKSLTPKYGFILMVLKALFLHQVPDILFVPINISYERILEEKLFAFELLGIPKPKETTSGFFKSLSIVKEKYGSIYADFAAPISAKAFFGAALDRNLHNIGPIHQQEVTDAEKRLIPALAHEIVRQQQKRSVTSIFSLIAVVLLKRYASEGAPLQLDELVREVGGLKRVVECFGGFVSCMGSKVDVLGALDVHRNIFEVGKDGNVALVWDKVVLDKFDPNRLKAHSLLEKTITYSVPFMMLQIYINPILHYLVDSAVLVVVLQKLQKSTSKDELYENYHFLRFLLSHEFVYYQANEKKEFENGLSKALTLGLIIESNGLYLIGPNADLQKLFKILLDSFLFTYLTVLLVLERTSTNVSEKNVLARSQTIIEDIINKKQLFVHPYSLSLDTMANCLSSLTEKSALKKIRENGTLYYEIDPSKITAIKTSLEEYVLSGGLGNMESVQLYLKTKL